MSKMTVNGVSTTRNRGQFQCERYYDCVTRKAWVQWDYRDADGKLHTGIAKTEEEARAKAAKFGYWRNELC